MSGVKGKSGRKPKPDALKELAGTYRADRSNPDQPTLTPLEALPRCPTNIKGEARKAWSKVGKLLLGMGVLTVADLHALEAYCTVYARWQDAEANLVTYGVMFTREGQLFPSPYLRIAEDSLKQLRAWMLEFGITPSSRSRVNAEKKRASELPNDTEDWFNDHKN